MSEDQQALTGQVILSEATAMEGTAEDALEAAVCEHARLVYRIAYSVLRNAEDAEDVTQETFLRVLRYGRKLRRIEDRRSWVARIAWRVAVDHHKRRKHLAGLADGDELLLRLPSLDTGAEEKAIGAQMAGVVEKLITSLPAPLQNVVALSTLEEMSQFDIARVLGIRETVVRSRLFRARAILREKLLSFTGGRRGA